MSSGKATATPQNSNTTATNQSNQQQPPKAPMSYSRAANAPTPALPRPGKFSTIAQHQAPSTTAGLSAQAAAFRPPPSLNTLSIADTPQPTTESVMPAHSVSSSDAQSSSVPFKLSANSSSTSASGRDDSDMDKNSKASEKSDKAVARLTFFDEIYAESRGPGTAGRRVKIRVNRLPIEPKFLPAQYHVYIVNFPQIRNRDVKNANVKKLMLTQILQDPALSTLDSRNELFTDWENTIITKQPLDDNLFANGTYYFNVRFTNQSDPNAGPLVYPATLDRHAPLDMAPLRSYLNGNQPANFNFSEYTRTFNILARHFAARDPTIARAGRNRIFPPNPRFQLPSTMHARAGFFNSIRPVQRGLQLQINTTAAAFHPSVDLITYLGRRFQPRDFNLTTGHMSDEAKGAIRGLQVRYMYLPPNTLPPGQTRSPILQNPVAQGQLKRINGFGEPANQQMFPLPPVAGTMSVQNHFNQNVLLQPLGHAQLPVVNTGAANGNGRPAFIPMELLWVEPNQALRTTVPQSDMTVMANHSRRLPYQNVAMIQGQGLGLIQATNLLQHSILSIVPNLLMIDGRMLAAPVLRYRGNREVRNDSGKWNLKGATFRVGSTLNRLFVITVGWPPNTIQPQAITGLSGALRTYGVANAGHQTAHATRALQTELNTAYASLQTGQSPPLAMLIVLSSDDISNYATVKHWGDCIKGVSTICITKGKVAKLAADPTMQANIALKFNAKLGGKNHILSAQAYSVLHGPSGSTMVVGADVTHPGPSSIQYCPSITAVVASTDRDCVKFPGSMRLQRGRTEEILDLQDMMVERLRLWSNSNGGNLPTRILFYRDGVGEDQFAMVKRHELPAVRAACAAVQPGYNPPITMVVCTKRHQLRFYPEENKTDPTNNTDPSCVDRGNFKPGLVVDTQQIRLPKLFDFYLQAHKPLQGTGRPCHYFVLENGINMSPDQLQHVTYSLSWVYATSVTPISVVAPAYYADKLAERGRCYIRPLLIGNHRDRPTQAQRNALLPAPAWRNATDEQKRDEVARQVKNGWLGFWQHGTASAPCPPGVVDTMFYV